MRFKSMLRTPAVKALLLQILACGITFLLLTGLAHVHGWIGLFPAVLIQGASAGLLSFYYRQAQWWIAIQFFFPIIVVLTLALQLPPSIFLVVFLLFLLVFWSTFRTQVPFYPSRASVQTAIADLLPADRTICFIDIGSGLGDLVLRLAERFPDHRFSGIEIAPLPWLVSWLRACFSGNRASFMCGDYERLNFSEYDMIFAYLSPAAMPGLWQKAQAEMRKDALLLSYEFSIPDIPSTFVINSAESEIQLYGFRM